MFKILSILEDDTANIIAVPEIWERNNLLLWPGHLNKFELERLRSNPLSNPEDNWDKYPCVVKMTNISGFKEALKFESTFIECIDIESEECNLRKLPHCGVAPNVTSYNLTTDRNSMTPPSDHVVHNNTNNNGITLTESSVGKKNNQILTNTQAEIESVHLGGCNTNCTDTHYQNSCHECNNVLQLQRDLEIKMQNLQQHVQELQASNTKMDAKIDEILRIIGDANYPLSSSENCNTCNINLPITFPISEKESLDEFEMKLRSDETFREKILQLTKIGGDSGKQDGFKIAYKVVDYMFSPELLVCYTWTGISKEAGISKGAFQKFEQILQVLFTVVRKADDRYTMQRNTEFFKDRVLKHSKKRNMRIKDRQKRKNKDTATLESQNPENSEAIV